MTAQISPTSHKQSFFSRPSTRLGWWSFGLGVLFILLFLVNSFVFMPLQTNEPWQQIVLPFYGIFMLLCGLASGATGLIAILRRGERSWLAWLPVLFALWVLFMVFGEILFPH